MGRVTRAVDRISGANEQRLQERVDQLQQDLARVRARRDKIKSQRDTAKSRLQERRVKERFKQGRDLDYVFVVTYGRSGSTLIMGVLNSLPGYLLRGENLDALRLLYDFHERMVEGSQRQKQERMRERTHPFFGMGDYPVNKALAELRRLALATVLRPKEDTRVTGFKEIRWEHDDLEDYLAWIAEVFPRARFVVNTRDLDDVMQSKWWAEGDLEENRERLTTQDARLRAVCERLGDAAYHVHYDEYVADPTVLRGLVEWLGETWDEDAIRETMSVKHSY